MRTCCRVVVCTASLTVAYVPRPMVRTSAYGPIVSFAAVVSTGDRPSVGDAAAAAAMLHAHAPGGATPTAAPSARPRTKLFYLARPRRVTAQRRPD
jgi:hypothetical protein